MGRKVTKPLLRNLRLVDVNSESSWVVDFPSLFMWLAVKNRKEKREED